MKYGFIVSIGNGDGKGEQELVIFDERNNINTVKKAVATMVVAWDKEFAKWSKGTNPNDVFVSTVLPLLEEGGDVYLEDLGEKKEWMLQYDNTWELL